MKWVWIIPGSFVVAIALIAIIGTMLPVKHTASRRSQYRQSADAVWAAIAGPQDWAPKNDPPITYEVVESVPPQRLVRRIADKNLPFGGSWTYEVEPVAGGSALRITENGEVYNPIFRFVSRFVMGHTRTIDETLKALGKKFGEQPGIED